MADDSLALNIPINAITDGFNSAMQGVQDTVSGAMGGVKSKLGEVQEAMGAVGLLAGNYLIGAVNSAAKAQTSTVQLQTLLKNQGVAFQDTAKDISAFTSGITKMSTYSAGEAKNALINLTEKGVTYSDSLKSQSALANLAAGTQTDLTSSSTLLAQAYNGRYTQLEKLGIVTKAQVKDGITYSQVLDAINQRFSGAAAAQMDTYAGQTKILANNMASMKTAIGTALLPVLTQLMEIINKTLSPMIAFIKAHAQLAAAILVTVTAVGTLVGGFALFTKVSSILGPSVEGIIGLIGGLSLPIAGVIAAIAGLVAAYTTNFGGMKTFIDGVFKSIKDSVQVGIDTFNKFHSVFGAIHVALENLFGDNIADKIMTPISEIRDIISIFIAFVKGDFSTVKDLLAEGFGVKDGTINKIMTTFEQLKSNAISAIQSIISLVKQEVPNIVAIISATISVIKGAITNILIPVFGLIISIISSVISFIKTNWGTISAVIIGVFTVITAAYNNIFAPAMRGIMIIFGSVVDFISSHQVIINTVLTTLGVVVAINTAKLILNTGALILNNAQKMIAKEIDIAETVYIKALYAAEAIYNATIGGGIVAMIASNAQKVIAKACDIGSTISIVALYVAEGIHNGIMIAGTIAQIALTAATSAFGIVMAIVTSPIFLVIAALALLGLGIYEIVTHWNIISAKTQEVWEGIKSTVGGAVGNIASTIVSGFDGAIGFITSLPGKALGWGKDFIDGLVNGIKSAIGGITSAATSVATAISNILHHSVPDEGPLQHDDEWGGDMVDNIANGINNSKNKITNAIKGLATDMSVGIKYNTIPSASNAIQNSVQAQTNSQTSGANSNASNNGTTVLNMQVDGKTWASASLQYTELTQGRNNKFTSRRVGVTNG